jgi:hypothetical protein
MANLKRVRIDWTGTAVTGGGVTTLYFDATATGFVSALATALTAWKAYLPNTVNYFLHNTGETVDMATGKPNGVWTDGSNASANGSSATPFAAGVGARVVWDTGGFNNGRRVRGASFLVPLVTTAYDVGGSIEATALSALQTAASALVTAQTPHFVVFTRPTAARPIGASAAVTAAVVPDQVSWLRSRRT